MLEDAEEIGLPYIGTASSPGARYGETVAGYQQAAEDFNTFGAAARRHGLRFYQHNHSGEFALENGTRLYDVILEETNPRRAALTARRRLGPRRAPSRRAAGTSCVLRR